MTRGHTCVLGADASASRNDRCADDQTCVPNPVSGKGMCQPQGFQLPGDLPNPLPTGR
jgi:hypothetical protein